MPNIDSAKKRARQNAKRTAVNHARKSRVRSFTRNVEEALAAGDRDAALNALKAAEPELMRGASKGVIHPNTARRKVSRLAKRAAKLQKK
jgi:small subunit ribosomal protein S20